MPESVPPDSTPPDDISPRGLRRCSASLAGLCPNSPSRASIRSSFSWWEPARSPSSPSSLRPQGSTSCPPASSPRRRRRWWWRGSARPVLSSWSSDWVRLARKPLLASSTGRSEAERSADGGAGDPVDREGVLDIGPFDRAVGAPTLDPLGIEEYSLCSAVCVGITDPYPDAVGRGFTKEGQCHGRLGGRQPWSRL